MLLAVGRVAIFSSGEDTVALGILVAVNKEQRLCRVAVSEGKDHYGLYTIPVGLVTITSTKGILEQEKEAIALEDGWIIALDAVNIEPAAEE